MPASVSFKIDSGALNALLRGTTGPVVKELNRRGMQVTNGAKRRCPVNMGRLRASITQSIGSLNGLPACFIGTNVEYALFVHNGTGIYGPNHAMIKPKHGKFLVFTPRGGATVFARQVRGVRPRPFLLDALQDARG